MFVEAVIPTPSPLQRFRFDAKMVFGCGWELLRTSPRSFFKSFTLMPYILIDRLLLVDKEQAVNKLATRLFSTVTKLPLSEAQALQMQQRPLQYSLLIAHKVTLILWFVPRMRLVLTYKVQKSLSRYWCWKHDIDPKKAALPF